MVMSIRNSQALQGDGMDSRCDFRHCVPVRRWHVVSAAILANLLGVSFVTAQQISSGEPSPPQIDLPSNQVTTTPPPLFSSPRSGGGQLESQTGLAFNGGGLRNATLPSVPSDLLVTAPPGATENRDWEWQKLPNGVIYSSYLARPKEPRMAAVFNHDTDLGWMLDLEAGARVGLLRYGTSGVPHPDGWELDIEGAAFPRLDLEHDEDLVSADFRVGVPLTFGAGPFQTKLEVYHLSSHLGDEFMLRFPDYPRINYSRNALVLGGSYYPCDDLRLYAEAEWAFYTDGGTKPWEFQFGLEYSPSWSIFRADSAPFVALNGQILQEVDYDGNLVVQVGWQWKGPSNHRFRIGAQYFTGKSDQYQFYTRHEEKLGIGAWYDF